jgi:RNA polymerase sigma-70 factor (ECF subfamily)
MPPALTALISSARAAWPELAVDEAAFLAFMLERVEEPAGLSEERAAELVLAFACSVADPRALEAFEQRYTARVPDWVRRIDRNPAFAAEVQQILRERLLTGSPPRIAEFRGSGSLEGWLRVSATRAALELLRAGKREQPIDEPSELAGEWLDDPELEYLKARYRDDFKQALSEALESLGDRERAVLGMYLVDGLNIERIGKLYDVHRATVARWISAAREELYAGAQRRLGERLAISAGEFESIARLVRSQLDLSVRRILADRQENQSA